MRWRGRPRRLAIDLASAQSTEHNGERHIRHGLADSIPGKSSHPVRARPSASAAWLRRRAHILARAQERTSRPSTVDALKRILIGKPISRETRPAARASGLPEDPPVQKWGFDWLPGRGEEHTLRERMGPPDFKRRALADEPRGVVVWFATDRRCEPSEVVSFSGKPSGAENGRAAMTYGTAYITLPPGHVTGRIEQRHFWQVVIDPNDAYRFIVIHPPQVLSVNRFFSDVAAHVRAARVLVESVACAQAKHSRQHGDVLVDRMPVGRKLCAESRPKAKHEWRALFRRIAFDDGHFGAAEGVAGRRRNVGPVGRNWLPLDVVRCDHQVRSCRRCRLPPRSPDHASRQNECARNETSKLHVNLLAASHMACVV
jgi:hypothetical protein